MADVEINLEITNPQELIGLGLRAYAIGDFTNAAAAYGRATQLLAQEHGDEHDSLGEVLLNYGRALLEVSREESEPLGDAIPQGESDSDSDEVEGENGVADGAENKDETTENKPEEDEKPAEKSEGGDKSEEESKDAKTGDDTKPEQATEETSVEKKEEVSQNGEAKTEETVDEAGGSGDNEECTDLQLAWEVLEVAKRIFSKRGNDGKGLLSETLVLLGEVAMESENFADGVNDIKAGLELQQSAYEPTSRKLAETYYKLGMALSTVSNIEEAVTNFEMSIKTLKARIELLKKTLQEEDDEKVEKPTEDKVTEKEEKSEGDEKEKPEKDGEETDDKTDENAVKEAKSKAAKRLLMKEEIKDMEALIPEIEEKINDTKSIKEEMATKLMEELTSKPKSSDGAGSSKTATDISHLVKRKRKSEEEVGEQAVPTKKPSP